MTDLYEFLDTHGVGYDRHDHPPVYTVEESKQLVPEIPGGKTKNLFLRDKKGTRHILLTVEQDKRVDLKRVSEVAESSTIFRKKMNASTVSFNVTPRSAISVPYSRPSR